MCCEHCDCERRSSDATAVSAAGTDRRQAMWCRAAQQQISLSRSSLSARLRVHAYIGRAPDGRAPPHRGQAPRRGGARGAQPARAGAHRRERGRHRAPLASRWRLLTAAAVGAALASAAILVANAFLAPPAAPGAAEVQQGAPLAEVRLSAGGSCKASSSWRRLAHILGHLLRFPEPTLPRGRSSILLIRDKHSERCIQLPRGQKASQVGRKSGQFARCWFGRI